MRLVSFLTSPCGHSAMLRNEEALAGAAEVLRDWTKPRITFGGYGSVKAGDTRAQVVAAVPPDAEHQMFGPCELIGMPKTYEDPFSVGYLVGAEGTVLGVYPPKSARTVGGLGRGATAAQIRSAHPGSELEWSYGYGGWVAILTMPGAPDRAMGFQFPDDWSPETPPPASARSVWVTAGTRDFAAGWELCSDAG